MLILKIFYATLHTLQQMFKQKRFQKLRNLYKLVNQNKHNLIQQKTKANLRKCNGFLIHIKISSLLQSISRFRDLEMYCICLPFPFPIPIPINFLPIPLHACNVHVCMYIVHTIQHIHTYIHLHVLCKVLCIMYTTEEKREPLPLSFDRIQFPVQ